MAISIAESQFVDLDPGQPVARHANATEEIFSGSIVADTHNTSGLGAPGETPLMALYTSVYKAGSGHAPGTQAQSLV